MQDPSHGLDIGLLVDEYERVEGFFAASQKPISQIDQPQGVSGDQQVPEIISDCIVHLQFNCIPDRAGLDITLLIDVYEYVEFTTTSPKKVDKSQVVLQQEIVVPSSQIEQPQSGEITSSSEQIQKDQISSLEHPLPSTDTDQSQPSTIEESKSEISSTPEIQKDQVTSQEQLQQDQISSPDQQISSSEQIQSQSSEQIQQDQISSPEQQVQPQSSDQSIISQPETKLDEAISQPEIPQDLEKGEIISDCTVDLLFKNQESRSGLDIGLVIDEYERVEGFFAASQMPASQIQQSQDGSGEQPIQIPEKTISDCVVHLQFRHDDEASGLDIGLVTDEYEQTQASFKAPKISKSQEIPPVSSEQPLPSELPIQQDLPLQSEEIPKSIEETQKPREIQQQQDSQTLPTPSEPESIQSETSTDLYFVHREEASGLEIVLVTDEYSCVEFRSGKSKEISQSQIPAPESQQQQPQTQKSSPEITQTSQQQPIVEPKIQDIVSEIWPSEEKRDDSGQIQPSVESQQIPSQQKDLDSQQKQPEIISSEISGTVPLILEQSEVTEKISVPTSQEIPSISPESKDLDSQQKISEPVPSETSGLVPQISDQGEVTEKISIPSTGDLPSSSSEKQELDGQQKTTESVPSETSGIVPQISDQGEVTEKIPIPSSQELPSTSPESQKQSDVVQPSEIPQEIVQKDIISDCSVDLQFSRNDQASGLDIGLVIDEYDRVEGFFAAPQKLISQISQQQPDGSISETPVQEKISDCVVHLQFKHDDEASGLDIGLLVDIYEAVQLNVKAIPKDLPKSELPSQEVSVPSSQVEQPQQVLSEESKSDVIPTPDVQEDQLSSPKQLSPQSDEQQVPVSIGERKDESISSQPEISKDQIPSEQLPTSDTSLPSDVVQPQPSPVEESKDQIISQPEIQKELISDCIIDLEFQNPESRSGLEIGLMVDEYVNVEGFFAAPQKPISQIQQPDGSISEQPISEKISDCMVHLQFRHDDEASGLDIGLLMDMYESVQLNTKSVPKILPKAELPSQEIQQTPVPSSQLEQHQQIISEDRKDEIVSQPEISRDIVSESEQIQGSQEQVLSPPSEEQPLISTSEEKRDEAIPPSELPKDLSSDCSVDLLFNRDQSQSGIECAILADIFEQVQLSLKSEKRKSISQPKPEVPVSDGEQLPQPSIEEKLLDQPKIEEKPIESISEEKRSEDLPLASAQIVQETPLETPRDQDCNVDLLFTRNDQNSGLDIGLVIDEYDRVEGFFAAPQKPTSQLQQQPDGSISEQPIPEKISDCVVHLQFRHDDEISGLDIGLVVDTYESCQLKATSSSKPIQKQPGTVPQEIVSPPSSQIEQTPQGTTEDKISDVVSQPEIQKDQIQPEQIPSTSEQIQIPSSEQPVISSEEKRDEIIPQPETLKELISDCIIDLEFRNPESRSGLEIGLMVDEYVNVEGFFAAPQKQTIQTEQLLPDGSISEKPMPEIISDCIVHLQFNRTEDISGLDIGLVTDEFVQVQGIFPASKSTKLVKEPFSSDQALPTPSSEKQESVQSQETQKPSDVSPPETQKPSDVTPQEISKSEDSVQPIFSSSEEKHDEPTSQQPEIQKELEKREIISDCIIDLEFRNPESYSGLEIGLIIDEYVFVEGFFAAPQKQLIQTEQLPDGSIGEKPMPEIISDCMVHLQFKHDNEASGLDIGLVTDEFIQVQGTFSASKISAKLDKSPSTTEQQSQIRQSDDQSSQEQQKIDQPSLSQDLPKAEQPSPNIDQSIQDQSKIEQPGPSQDQPSIVDQSIQDQGKIEQPSLPDQSKIEELPSQELSQIDQPLSQEQSKTDQPSLPDQAKIDQPSQTDSSKVEEIAQPQEISKTSDDSSQQQIPVPESKIPQIPSEQEQPILSDMTTDLFFQRREETSGLEIALIVDVFEAVALSLKSSKSGKSEEIPKPSEPVQPQPQQQQPGSGFQKESEQASSESSFVEPVKESVSRTIPQIQKDSRSIPDQSVQKIEEQPTPSIVEEKQEEVSSPQQIQEAPSSKLEQIREIECSVDLEFNRSIEASGLEIGLLMDEYVKVEGFFAVPKLSKPQIQQPQENISGDQQVPEISKDSVASEPERISDCVVHLQFNRDQPQSGLECSILADIIESVQCNLKAVKRKSISQVPPEAQVSTPEQPSSQPIVEEKPKDLSSSEQIQTSGDQVQPQIANIEQPTISSPETKQEESIPSSEPQKDQISTPSEQSITSAPESKEEGPLPTPEVTKDQVSIPPEQIQPQIIDQPSISEPEVQQQDQSSQPEIPEEQEKREPLSDITVVHLVFNREESISGIECAILADIFEQVSLSVKSEKRKSISQVQQPSTEVQPQPTQEISQPSSEIQPQPSQELQQIPTVVEKHDDVVPPQEITKDLISDCTTDLEFRCPESRSGLEIGLLMDEYVRVEGFFTAPQKPISQIQQPQEGVSGDQQVLAAPTEQRIISDCVVHLQFNRDQPQSGIECSIIADIFEAVQCSLRAEKRKSISLPKPESTEQKIDSIQPQQKQPSEMSSQPQEVKSVEQKIDTAQQQQEPSEKLTEPIIEVPQQPQQQPAEISSQQPAEKSSEPISDVSQQQQVSSDLAAPEVKPESLISDHTVDLVFTKDEQKSGLEVGLCVDEYDHVILSVKSIGKTQPTKLEPSLQTPSEVPQETSVLSTGISEPQVVDDSHQRQPNGKVPMTAEPDLKEIVLSIDVSFSRKEEVSGLEVDLVVDLYEQVQFTTKPGKLLSQQPSSVPQPEVKQDVAVVETKSSQSTDKIQSQEEAVFFLYMVYKYCRHALLSFEGAKFQYIIFYIGHSIYADPLWVRMFHQSR
ncbi:hypothetical protein WR25_05923 isoform B [Diploscapter pachys]|uniref:Uncharacterized protein n=1 Tax=Diploscapter pachys TaxID=2018661 RepID=A0A2A2KMZ1_9BILA|nr:hypothetical protein WR25_05923 isoform B [Diploscapter pachys]